MRYFTRKSLLGAGASALVLGAIALTSAQAQAQTAAPSPAPTAKTVDNSVVVVTARRKALKSAIEIKKNSDTIVDSIVADEAGQLPDTSITEVLSRVSGVTLSRFSSVGSSGTPSFQIEGSGIQVRGLPYNASTLNGRQAFSANGANALSWGDVTPELAAGVDVYKAARADIIEGGTSSVDLRTRMPFDYKKPEFDVSLGASYGDQVKKISPDMSMLYTRRFDTNHGEMGFLIDVAHSQYYSQDSDSQIGAYKMENDPNVASGRALVPTGYKWSQHTNKRDRDGFYAAFQWKPSDSLLLNTTLFYSGYKTQSEGHDGGWDNRPNPTNENIPTDATFDDAGAMTNGALHIGGTGAGTPIFGWGGNNWLAQYYNPADPAYNYIGFMGTPLPQLLNADCRTQYGSLNASSVDINWGNWDSPGQKDSSGNIIPNTGMFYCKSSNNANGTITLNLSGSSSVSHNTSSTLDFSQSFVWTPNDALRVRGALQIVSSRTNGLGMFAGITQSDPALSSASFDATKNIPVLGGFDAAALVNTNTAFFNSFSYNGNQNKGTSVAANIDADYALGDDHFFKSVTFGARMTSRTERDNFVGTYWAPISEPWNAMPYPDQTSTPGWGPFLTGPKAVTGPYAVTGDKFQAYVLDGSGQRIRNSDGTYQTHEVQRDITITPNGTVKPGDYEVFNFPGYFGGSVQSPGAILVPSAELMQGYNWQQLASISANSQFGALSKARCAAEPTAVACDEKPWTTKGYYDTYIDRNLGITNTTLRNAAFYVEGKFGSDGFGFIPRFSGNVGVRVVRQILSGSGNLVVEGNNSFYLDQASAMAALANGGKPTQQGDVYQMSPDNVTRSKEISFTRALPSFNIKFDISPKLILRMAASQGMSPPNLGDIRAGGHVAAATDSRTGVAPGTQTPLTVNFLKNMVSQSGADMKPVMIASGDISMEWYPKDGVFAYLDFFGKELKDQDLYTYYYQVQPTPLLKGAAKTPVIVNLPWFYQQNTSIHKPAEIKGFEIGGRKFFDELPGIFKGFGVSGSLTYVDSRNPSQLANSVVGPYIPDFVYKGANSGGAGGVNAGNPDTDIKDLPYYGLSKVSYNVELYYSRGKLNTRIAYNWHSKQLLSTNANPLSFNSTGGNPYTCTACLDKNGGAIYEMVPLWSADAGYLDFGLDYRITDRITFGISASNLTNTVSKTLQEPLPGVFEPFDTYQSDRRASAYLRMRY
jgi:hypothetical protein